MLLAAKANMKTTLWVLAGVSLFALGVQGQTNRTDAAPRPPPPPPVPPLSAESFNYYRLQVTDQAATRRMEIDGALARLRKRAALAEQAVPPGGVRTREDTDRLTTDPVTREYTGYNLLVIKF